jgi:hypothetical protein
MRLFIVKTLGILIILLALILGWCLASYSAEQTPQIVLQFKQMHPDGKIRFFVPQQPIALGLIPLNNAAPLSPEALSICRMEIVKIAVKTLDGKDAGQLDDIIFHCGPDRYIFTTLAVLEK